MFLVSAKACVRDRFGYHVRRSFGGSSSSGLENSTNGRRSACGCFGGVWVDGDSSVNGRPSLRRRCRVSGRECHAKHDLGYQRSLSSRVHHANRRQTVFWWNCKFADARLEGVRLRRVFNRLHGHGHAVSTTVAKVKFRSARKKLKHRIRDSKAKCWTELVRSVDDDS